MSFYLSTNNLLNSFQSANIKHHSTEPTLHSVQDYIIIATVATSDQQVNCLTLFNLSATADTNDHSILLKRLSSLFGISSIVFSWITFYLLNRSVYVNIETRVLPYLIQQQTITSMLMILIVSYHSQLWISLITTLTLKHYNYIRESSTRFSLSHINLTKLVNLLNSTLFSFHIHRSTWSSSLNTLSRPILNSRLKIANKFFYHSAAVLWNSLPSAHRVTALPISNTPKS